MEQCSETSAHKIQTRNNRPKERVQHSHKGSNLNSSIKFCHHWSHEINV
jgi:hypothetical protein